MYDVVSSIFKLTGILHSIMRTEFIKLYGYIYIYDITVPYDIIQYYTVLYYIILYCINYIILYPIIPNILAILIFYLRVSKLLQAGELNSFKM